MSQRHFMLFQTIRLFGCVVLQLQTRVCHSRCCLHPSCPIMCSRWSFNSKLNKVVLHLSILTGLIMVHKSRVNDSNCMSWKYMWSHSCLISSDPRQWTETHVAEWLTWTVNEFSLKNVDFDKFCMNGALLCAMGKDRFLDLAPDFVGDILWEHLEMLQKGKRLLS